MKTMTLEEFKESSYIEIIEELIKRNNGYVTSKLVSALGIHRMYLKIMLERGQIKKVGNGIYTGLNTKPDYLFILSQENARLVYSHMTSLYLHGIAAKPKNDKYDISVPSKYHNTRLNNNNVYYVNEKNYNLGVVEVTTTQGNVVTAYDVERSICDIIKFKDNYDIEDIKSCIKKYLKSEKKDLNKLFNYASILGVKDIKLYIELLK